MDPFQPGECGTGWCRDRDERIHVVLQHWFRADLTGVTMREGVVLNVELAAGLSSKKHFHPGDEFIHIVEGSVAVGIEGKPEVIVSAGQTIHIPANAVHYGRNLSATTPAKAISFGVFEKGKPDMTVAP